MSRTGQNSKKPPLLAERQFGVKYLALIHVHVLQADPTLIGTAPCAADFQNLYLVVLGILADGFIGGACALTDVQGAGGDLTGAGGVGGRGAGGGNGDIVQTDPTLVGAAPVALDLQDGDLLTLLVGTDLIIGGACALADIQGGGIDGDGVVDLHGSRVGGGGTGAALDNVVQADPALVSAAPVTLDFQDLDLLTLGVVAHVIVGGAGAIADVQRTGVDRDGVVCLDGIFFPFYAKQELQI